MSRALWALVVFAAALLFHLPAREGEFLSYDDGRYVVRNDSIERIGNPLRFFTDPDTIASADAPTRDIYRPLRTLSFALLTQGFGKRAGPFHAAAILGHALAAWLLFALLRRLALPDWAAAAGALAWALHPVTVEVTAWVCSLGDVGCGVFVLLSMLAWAAGRRALAVGALVVALFWKEHAVVTPGLWLLWDRLRRPGGGDRRAALGWVAAGGVVVLAFLLWRGHVGAKMAQVPEPLGGSHVSAVLTMLAGLGWYALRILLPFGPSFDARVAVPDGPFEAPVLLGAAVLAALVALALRGPRATRLGAAWFLVALVPVSNVIVPLKIPTADRFLYLPLMGLALAGAAAAPRLARPARFAVPPVLLLLAALTVTRIGDWRDDGTLIAAGKRVNPRSKTWLWAEASQAAQDALARMRAGDFAGAAPVVDEAGRLYTRYLRNTVPYEQTQVFMEVGDFYHEVATHCDRVDLRAEAIRAYGQALESYRRAHALHREGVGRVIDVERERAADRIAAICLRLAEPENPHLADALKVGLEALQYLEGEFGRDVRLRFAQFVIIGAHRFRAREPAAAREQLARALALLDELEEEGRPVAFLRAQAVFYSSILVDRPPDVAGLVRAWELFGEAETELEENRLRAMLERARVAGVLKENVPSLDEEARAEWRDRGLALLARIPEVARAAGQRIPEYMRRQIESLRRKLELPL